VSSSLLSHTPHRRRTGGSRGATQRGVRLDLGGVSQLTFWRNGWTLVYFIFIFYFVRLPLCNKYSDDIVTFISIHSIIICVVFFDAYMRCTRLYPLNPGVIALHLGMAAGRILFGYNNTQPKIVPKTSTNIHTHQANRSRNCTCTHAHRVSTGYRVSSGYVTID
jgi:hypothetical protein